MSRSVRTLARLLVIVLSVSAVSGAFSPRAEAQAADAKQLWEDFCHYVLIARPQLAGDAGTRLLDSADAETLLSAVEGSTYDAQKVLARARKTETVKDVAAQLATAIQDARIDRARDPERIARDIEMLALGDRANLNATARLKAAGQYAAPQLLATLQDPEKSDLHPFVITAMAAIGEDLVYPLSVALPDLEPVQMSQVAQVLSRIGYPTPLPYMKQIMEASEVDPNARRTVTTAYNTLVAQTALDPELSAAELYTTLGRSHYRAGTQGSPVTGYDEATGQGIVWDYLSRPQPALVPIFVPGPIYADARALRDAKAALALNPAHDEALSLYLASNFRRENRLPEGEQDPSYQEPQPASFYANLAGPQRLHDVLTIALDDGDADLALDAIAALAGTAGTEALTTTRPSLLRGLTYPDRRVRFRSAEALAQARPDEPFDSSYNVVKILGDQVRQSDKRYAMVLAGDQQTVNELVASISELGYETFGATQIGDLTDDINSRPGIDLIVAHGEAEDIKNLVAQTAIDFKLNSSPLLALVSPGDQIRLKAELTQPRVTPIVQTQVADELAPAVEAARDKVTGEPIEGEEALAFAVTAIELLRDIALTKSDVYNILDAQPALEGALSDDRDPVVTGAGSVLALLGNESAQQAIFNAALETEGEVQISLLDSLAQSAQHHGNVSTQQQTEALLTLVRDSSGQTAIAAAKAHGSLMLSTPNAVSLINE